MHDWRNEPCRMLDESVRAQALARQDQLTKPRGALGQLEALARNDVEADARTLDDVRLEPVA